MTSGNCGCALASCAAEAFAAAIAAGLSDVDCAAGGGGGGGDADTRAARPHRQSATRRAIEARGREVRARCVARPRFVVSHVDAAMTLRAV